MKKKLLLFLLLTISVLSYAQTYNNEWIDYSKTYYKFSVGATGLYRIPQSALAAAGIGSTPAEQFQLWHNGLEVPLYTTLTTGAMGSSDYIEFYGLINDGKLDTKLYKADSLQMSDHVSLYTDTSAYFLTVNPAGSNKRLLNTVNNVAGNTLTAEPYFMYTISEYYNQVQNQGFGYNLGEIIYSSSYETAEGWTSRPVGAGFGVLWDNLFPLQPYLAGPSGVMDIDIVGNTSNIRSVTAKINGTAVRTDTISAFNIDRMHVGNIALAPLGSIPNVTVVNNGVSGDVIAVADYRLTYPRQFDFAGQSNFYFELPATNTGNYLVISNFNYAGADPVLYDFTNQVRFTGVVSNGSVQFALPPSVAARKMVLLSTDASVVQLVNSVKQRNFIDFRNTTNQGDYLIISNPVLYNDGSGNNNVEKYRQYRSTVSGGGYNSKTIDIDQLIDQFAFGVKHHPASIRNFSAFALANFSVKPKFLFLIGKGLNYQQFRRYESNKAIVGEALVPTFGWPASDNLLGATRTGEYTTIPLGRLSAVNGTEIGNYLNKIIQFEQVQQTAPQTIAGKAWMKNVAQITGGLADPGLASLITSYMQKYSKIASDTLFSGNVFQFNQNTGLNTAAGTNTTLQDLFSNGLSLLTYFGHASPNSLEFNLYSPQNYDNTGKYPAIIVNGCNASDLFEFDTLRAFTGGSLSEKFTFADKKGSIAFISSSSFGLPTELDYINSGFYNNLCNYMYGQPIGNIMKTTMQNVYNVYFADYIAQTHVEEINLHGDPAVKLNPQTKPDFAIQDSLLTFDPSPVSVGSSTVTITARIINIGSASKDSLPVLIQRTLADGSIRVLFNGKIKSVKYEDSIVITLNINPLKDTGLNHITVTIDPNNTLTEVSKANNIISKDFNILNNQLLPIWPYQYAIVNNPLAHLYASTANPTAAFATYVMEMDTTALFNSAQKIRRTVTSLGGVIEFVPGMALNNNTVYYWRVGIGPIVDSLTWTNSSFVYINGTDSGFNESHYYQYTKNSFSGMNIDTATRNLQFNNETKNLLIRTGLYNYYDWDLINVNVGANQLQSYGCKYLSLQILVYDPLTLTPWQNYAVAGGGGLYGSWAPDCSGPTSNMFEFPYNDPAYRKNALQFLNSIPNGYIVSITNFSTIYNTTFIDQWKADTATLGSGISLWHTFHQLGLNQIDQFTTNLPFLFLFKKGDSTNFPIYQTVGPAISSGIENVYNIPGKDILGTQKTPWLGSAKAWKHFKWDEQTNPLSTTKKRFDIIGKDVNGNEITLASIYNAKDTDISFIDAAKYPNLKLLLYNQDSTHASTTQLKYWRLTASPVPEGAIAPNLSFNMEDTLNLSDTLHFKVAFKNVSDMAFDSIKTRITITDVNGNTHVYNNLINTARLKPLVPGDTALITYNIPVLSYPGRNQLMIEINPDNAQPEQSHLNNVLYQNFYVLSPVCPGGSTSFTTGSSILGYNYQWQVNNGSGYTDIQTNAIYSGQNSSTLLLSTPPTNMYGYKYRCVISGNFSNTYSPEFSLTFADNWTGNIDNAWEKTGNWNCGVLPDIYTDVLIKTGLINYPVVKSNAVCRSLSAAPATTVTISANNSLNVAGPPSGN